MGQPKILKSVMSHFGSSWVTAVMGHKLLRERQGIIFKILVLYKIANVQKCIFIFDHFDMACIRDFLVMFWSMFICDSAEPFW